jgi:branched-subunit amino acid transport protein
LPVQLLLGIGVPLVVVVIWARFMAPRSETRLTGAAYRALEFVLYGAAVLAAIFAVVVIVNEGLVWFGASGETPVT